MERKIWTFMILGLAVPMISGCDRTIVSCNALFSPPTQFQPVDIRDAAATTVTGINNAGEIVGYFANSQGITRRRSGL